MFENEDLNSKRKLEEEEDDTIEQEYRIWKKNAPLLYDSVLTHCLTWPSLTADFLPEVGANHKLVVGTQTADGSDNYLLVLGVKLPHTKQSEISIDEVPEHSRLSVLSMVPHPGEVNRAVHCPRNSFLIATKCIDGLVRVFDYSKHPSRPLSGAVAEKTLLGHTKEGFALAWSSYLLASGAEDGKVCVWDLAGATDAPVFTVDAHEGTAEAVSWKPNCGQALLSVGAQERIVKLWDIRAGNTATEVHKIGERGEVNAAVWCPHNPVLMATAGDDKVVRFFDLRNFSQTLHEIEDAHEDSITNLKWSSFSECVLASSGNDRRVAVYDLARVGDEFVIDEPGDAVPEILFIHGGHTGRVNDFTWTHDDSFTLASVADDNILQVWQVAETIYVDDQDDN